MFNLSRQARGENAFGTGLSPAEALRRKVLGSKQIPKKDSDLTLASLRLCGKTTFDECELFPPRR